ncbi:hypothetical protein [Geoglobus ahangari]
MSDYYQNVHLDLNGVDEMDFSFYYDSKRHRYRILVNYEEKLDVTRKEGETILAFLKILREVLSRAPSNISSKSRDSQDFERTLDILEVGSCSKNSSTPKEVEG